MSLANFMSKVPYMGPAPRSIDSMIKWKSQLQLDGTPMEYSWKWNTRTSPPDVRYGVEPIGQFAGTQLDPLNQRASLEVLHRLASALPGVDLSWTNHFISTLFDHDNTKYAKEAASGAHLGTSLLVSVELLRSGTGLKTYFQPRKLGQIGLMPRSHWVSAIKLLDPEQNPSLQALHEFLTTSAEGKLLSPFCLSVDNVDPAKSRLKWYFNSPHTSFVSVREIMTLGGRINTPKLEQQLVDLYELVKTVTGLPQDFSEASEVPAAAAPQYDALAKDNFAELDTLLIGNVYFFDIAPGKSLPEIKFYTPVRNYGRDDLSLATGLAQWMEAHGRGAYARNYLQMLETLGEHRRLDAENGLQTFLSCQFKSNGDLDITSYLAPEAFHPLRMERRRSPRSTLRRGD
jgi:DMATS type aromatic prenyltransferase